MKTLNEYVAYEIRRVGKTGYYIHQYALDVLPDTYIIVQRGTQSVLSLTTRGMGVSGRVHHILFNATSLHFERLVRREAEPLVRRDEPEIEHLARKEPAIVDTEPLVREELAIDIIEQRVFDVARQYGGTYFVKYRVEVREIMDYLYRKDLAPTSKEMCCCGTDTLCKVQQHHIPRRYAYLGAFGVSICAADVQSGKSRWILTEIVLVFINTGMFPVIVLRCINTDVQQCQEGIDDFNEMLREIPCNKNENGEPIVQLKFYDNDVNVYQHNTDRAFQIPVLVAKWYKPEVEGATDLVKRIVCNISNITGYMGQYPAHFVFDEGDTCIQESFKTVLSNINGGRGKKGKSRGKKGDQRSTAVIQTTLVGAILDPDNGDDDDGEEEGDGSHGGFTKNSVISGIGAVTFFTSTISTLLCNDIRSIRPGNIDVRVLDSPASYSGYKEANPNIPEHLRIKMRPAEQPGAALGDMLIDSRARRFVIAGNETKLCKTQINKVNTIDSYSSPDKNPLGKTLFAMTCNSKAILIRIYNPSNDVLVKWRAAMRLYFKSQLTEKAAESLETKNLDKTGELAFTVPTLIKTRIKTRNKISLRDKVSIRDMYRMLLSVQVIYDEIGEEDEDEEYNQDSILRLVCNYIKRHGSNIDNVGPDLCIVSGMITERCTTLEVGGFHVLKLTDLFFYGGLWHIDGIKQYTGRLAGHNPRGILKQLWAPEEFIPIIAMAIAFNKIVIDTAKKDGNRDLPAMLIEVYASIKEYVKKTKVVDQDSIHYPFLRLFLSGKKPIDISRAGASKLFKAKLAPMVTDAKKRKFGDFIAPYQLEAGPSEHALDDGCRVNHRRPKKAKKGPMNAWFNRVWKAPRTKTAFIEFMKTQPRTSKGSETTRCSADDLAQNEQLLQVGAISRMLRVLLLCIVATRLTVAYSLC
jgi:hypothetical protein